jgi:hypothetical protein
MPDTEKDFTYKIGTKRKKIMLVIFSILLYFFALVGLVFSGVFIAMNFKLTNVQGEIDSLSKFFNSVRDTTARKNVAEKTVVNWANTPEWTTMSTAFLKDKSSILKASNDSGVGSRVILSSIIAEQFRFFTSDRELFKRVFQPLQILGNLTQFSYGVAGIKTDTAIMIEENLKDKNSPYYPGTQYENLLDFTTADPNTERMNRLTDPKNHYYSYLYTGLFIKEMMTEWQNAGYPINDRPEILATLFNLGFAHSMPNANPETGGAVVTLGGKNYTFGGLAFDFYYSNELTQDFPN